MLRRREAKLVGEDLLSCGGGGGGGGGEDEDFQHTCTS